VSALGRSAAASAQTRLAPAVGHAALQRRFALRAHDRYLTMLLARYDGPLHAAWTADHARVRAALAAQ